MFLPAEKAQMSILPCMSYDVQFRGIHITITGSLLEQTDITAMYIMLNNLLV